MIPIDPDFGFIDLPNPNPCPKCKSRDRGLRSVTEEAGNAWKVICNKCYHNGPINEDPATAVLRWNDEKISNG